jgi:uncharacterized protein YcbK (DUF882 family)
MCNHCDDPSESRFLSRRALLAATVATAGLTIAPKSFAAAPRTLAFYHTHTKERLRVTYVEDGVPIPDALAEVSHFLRDFRTGDEHPVDPALLDVLYLLRARAGNKGTYEVISAYRSPKTNEMLRNRSSNSGVAERSLHMKGKAIDVRLTGVSTSRVREDALALRLGGVGYYADSNFVHVDTGRVRQW